MTKNLVLVGCGNVGSRHLQAVAKLPYDIVIDIVEPNKDAQALAKSRLNEIEYDKNNHNFFWRQSLDEVMNKSNLVIISTLSTGRIDIINQLLEKGHSRFLVEKMVCQSVEEYVSLLSQMKKFNAKGWVNTTPRCFKSYQKIKDHLGKTDMIHLSVLANSDAGLSTNAIHYIDLFCWLAEDYEIKLGGEFLSNELIPNKRGKNFKEFSGTLLGSLKNGSLLSLTFVPSYKGGVTVNISGNNEHFIIDETNEKITLLTERQNYDWKFKYEHVSSLTTAIAHDILEKDHCFLPNLHDSFYAHSELFRIFNLHVSRILKEDVQICPIT